MIKYRLIIFAFFSILITGCGFHLRGLNEGPGGIQHCAAAINIFIATDNHDLGDQLSDRLYVYNIHRVLDKSHAKYLLIIENDHFQEQVTSVSSSTTARQYSIIYTINFNLLTADGKNNLLNTPVIVTRQLTVQNNRILGSNSEETTIKQEMLREAVMQIITRLHKINLCENMNSFKAKQSSITHAN